MSILFSAWASNLVGAAETLELELVIEISRHGERASKKIFNITDGPNFEVGPKELTQTGAISHHKIGNALKMEFDECKLIDTNEYHCEEVYV